MWTALWHWVLMCTYYFPSFDFENIDQKLPPSTMHNNPVRGLTTPRKNHLMLTKKWISKPKDVNGWEPGRNWFTKFTSYLESLLWRKAIFFFFKLTQLFNWDTSNESSRRQALAQQRTEEKKAEMCNSFQS